MNFKAAFVDIPSKHKAPSKKGWNEREHVIYDKSKLNGGNRGLALAYCEPPVIALDIDHIPSAEKDLLELGIDIRTTEAVKIESGRPDSMCFLFRLPQGVKPPPSIQVSHEDRVSWELRCATGKGKTQCQVIPPSKHPSGTTYCWKGDKDLEEITEVPQALLTYIEQRSRATSEKRMLQPLEDSSLNQALDEETLQDMLDYISADCSYHDWLTVLFSIKSTGLSNAEVIARRWSESAPERFKFSSFKAVWDSYQDGHFTQGTVIYLAQQGGWRKKESSSTSHTSDVAYTSDLVCEPPQSARAALLNMAINPNLEAMRQQMLDDVFVIPDLAILGQITVFYAKPNTGKTLYLLHGLAQGVKNDGLEDKDIIFINADDTHKGGIEKGEILNGYGIRVLVPNQNGFKSSDLLPLLRQVIDSNDARDLILVVDTLKKFTDLMDKSKSSQFTELAREFVMAGGTLIGTAHANKNDNAAGEVVEAGTSDLKDDIDCAYTLKHIGEEGGTHTVELTNTKSRGDVIPKLVFQYTKVPSAGYKVMLESVKRLDRHEMEPLKERLAALRSLEENSDTINVITRVIREGNGDLYKGDIAVRASKETGVGINKIREIIRMHEGDKYDEHYRWTQRSNATGIKYELLGVPSVNDKTCN